MRKYYYIELLRFLCSLSVVVYHWGLSFDLMGMESNKTFDYYLKIIYGFGDKAVPVFFVISGLVFSNVYLSQKKNETLYNFSIKRFARLYPLHLFTLLSVLLIQYLFLVVFKEYQLYTFNDLYHFFLNIILLLGWGFEQGRSFNTPVWTVGQEMFIYFLFFSLIVFIKRYQTKFVFFIYLFFLIVDKTKITEHNLVKDFIYFSYFIDFVRLYFSGVIIYYMVEKFGYSKILLILSSLIIFLSFVGAFRLHLFCFGVVMLFVILDRFNINNKIKKIFIFLGSLTYSLYLLHTLTFLIFLFSLKFFDKVDLFYYDSTFVIYLIFTIVISILSFKFFESKLNKLIRYKFIK